VWDPTLVEDIESLDILQHKAVRFIARLIGRESVSEVWSQLGH